MRDKTKKTILQSEWFFVVFFLDYLPVVPPVEVPPVEELLVPVVPVVEPVEEVPVVAEVVEPVDPVVPDVVKPVVPVVELVEDVPVLPVVPEVVIPVVPEVVPLVLLVVEVLLVELVVLVVLVVPVLEGLVEPEVVCSWKFSATVSLEKDKRAMEEIRLAAMIKLPVFMIYILKFSLNTFIKIMPDKNRAFRFQPLIFLSENSLHFCDPNPLQFDTCGLTFTPLVLEFHCIYNFALQFSDSPCSTQLFSDVTPTMVGFAQFITG